jgi:hypothetical protein
MPWAFHGYGDPIQAPSDPVRVLTPSSIVRTFPARSVPHLHASAFGRNLGLQVVAPEAHDPAALGSVPNSYVVIDDQLRRTAWASRTLSLRARIL